MQPGAVAIADEDEGARPLLQHVGEILRAHQRRNVGIDLVPPAISRATSAAKAVSRVVVHHHRIAMVIIDLGGRAVKLGRAFDHLADAFLQQFADLLASGCARCRAAARAAE